MDGASRPRRISSIQQRLLLLFPTTYIFRPPTGAMNPYSASRFATTSTEKFGMRRPTNSYYDTCQNGDFGIFKTVQAENQGNVASSHDDRITNGGKVDFHTVSGQQFLHHPTGRLPTYPLQLPATQFHHTTTGIGAGGGGAYGASPAESVPPPPTSTECYNIADDSDTSDEESDDEIDNHPDPHPSDPDMTGWSSNQVGC